LAGTVSVYPADECTLVTADDRRSLLSADNRTCLVKRSRNQFGDRCFATTGPTLCNNNTCNLFSSNTSACGFVLVGTKNNNNNNIADNVYRAVIMNNLPEQLRQPDITFGQFKRSLKTFMHDSKILSLVASRLLHR